MKEHWTGAQDDSERSMEGTTHHVKVGQIDPDMETDIVLKKEDLTDETNTEVINKIRMDSNKVCIRNDLAKMNVIFSEESCQTVIDMRNAEFIALTNFRIQCTSCLHCTFEGTTVMLRGKHIKSNKEIIQRIKEASEKLKTPFFRASFPNSRLQVWNFVTTS